MTITFNNKKIKAKPMKDNRGNEGYFILAKELGKIKPAAAVKKKKTKAKPSPYPHIKEAIEEMGLILKGKMPAVDAKSWIKSL